MPPAWSIKAPGKASEPNDEDSDQDELFDGTPDTPGRDPPKAVCRTELVLMIFLWYLTSATMIFMNKWAFGVAHIRFPLLVTATHLLMKAPLAALVLRARDMPVSLFEADYSRTTWAALACAGCAAAADIGLSNASFMYISITTYTIVKASVPAWILCFSLGLGLVRFKPSLLLVVALLGGGICLGAVPDGEWDAPSDGGVPMISAPLEEHTRLAAASAHRRGSTHPLLTWAERESRRAVWMSLGLGGDLYADGWIAHPSSYVPTAAHGLRGGALRPHPLPQRWPPPQKPQQQARRTLRRPARAASATRTARTRRLGDGEDGDGAAAQRPLVGPSEDSLEDSSEEVNSDDGQLLGVAFVLVAALCSGLRWAVMQKLMQFRTPSGSAEPKRAPTSAPAALPPLVVMMRTAPFGVALLLPLALVVELGEARAYCQGSEDGGSTVARLLALAALLCGGGLLAFVMLLCELRVVQLASGMTLSVAGVLKEVVTVLASVVLFGDSVTEYKAAGLGLCVVGILVYQRVSAR